MSGERLSVFDDPRVKAALREGRHPDDISILSCPACGIHGYYNDGSSFTCLHCQKSWRVVAPEDFEFETYHPEDFEFGGMYHGEQVSVLVVDECNTLQDAIDCETENPY